jgi:hypothetical protein
MNPAAIERDCQCGGKQTGKGPIEAVFNDGAAERRIFQVGVVGEDGLVGDGRIVKRERTGKVPIACNAVGICRMKLRQ